MRIKVLLSSAALVAAASSSALACSWGESKMTMAKHDAVPATVVTIPEAPVEVALRDVWLERMVG